MMLVTSAPNAYWNTTGTLSAVTTGNADVTVNDATTMQTWEGFGGAFNEMGWNYLSMLSPADRDEALQLLFGADGARFAWGRIPIGASDYAMSRYTLRRDRERHRPTGELLDHARQAEADPVHQGGASGEAATSASGPARGRRRPG